MLAKLASAAMMPRVKSAWSLRFRVSRVSVALFQWGLVGFLPSYSSMANSAVYPSDQKGPSSPHPQDQSRTRVVSKFV